MISYVGRLIYTFDQKYILTASIRDDGSSKFGPSNRWAIFPAVAAAWRIKQEKFLSGVDWLTDLKVRASYGSDRETRTESMITNMSPSIP